MVGIIPSIMLKLLKIEFWGLDMVDEVYLYSTLAIWIITSIIVTKTLLKSEKKPIFIALYNLVIFLTVAHFWFWNISKDGVSQVNGLLLYAAVGIVLSIVEYYIIKNKKLEV
jgi:hypothetical protein